MCNLTPCFQLQALEAFKTLENTIKENEMWAPFFFSKINPVISHNSLKWWKNTNILFQTNDCEENVLIIPAGPWLDLLGVVTSKKTV